MAKRVNFLLCCPSPRDIQEVYDALKKCPYDRLYAKYFPELQAYNLMRDYFLSHTRYTHMVICPDDLIIEAHNVEMIRQLIDDNNYDVIAGCCNVDLGENLDLLNIAKNLPHPTRWVPERNQIGWRTYDWYHKNEAQSGEVLPVKFSGFACQAISRWACKQLKFQDDSKFNGQPDFMTGAIDVMFANQCFARNPPILQMVDFGNRMKHLKLQTRYQDIQLGDGELRFYPKHKDMFQMIFKEPIGQKREWLMHKDDKVVEGIAKRVTVKGMDSWGNPV